jgi:2-polyprenyl-6-hydroxyphenyl methylase/3-demethylubiquinone-9 3-methyltransferase
MEVNNTIYESSGHAWWDEKAGFELSSLRYCVNPVRYRYFRNQLQDIALPGKAVLDIGCGGGFLSEQFVADGFDVTGIDPAANSIAAARKHAAQSGLPIQYRVGRGEALPFPDGAFDIVVCCDVLEHVDCVSEVVREVSRTLKPGGVFLYDTINRTMKSKILLIKVCQDWGLAGFSECAHVWEKFIRPDEMTTLMSANGLTPGGMKGFVPGKNPLSVVCTLLKIRRGLVCGPALAEALPMRETDDLGVSYMGWAVKAKHIMGAGAGSR